MEYIELNREFHKIDFSDKPSDEEFDFARAYYGETDNLKWSDLYEKFRVVILSEAGAGKTTEIRQATKELIKKGKAAFFIRLEHVSEDFENAFEEGTFEEFEAWKSSSHEGWLFLDSVDEARIVNPRAFHFALKIISNCLEGAVNRLHVIISSRVEAWRSRSDLETFLEYFPTSQVEVEPNKEHNADTKDQVIIVSLADLVSSQIEIFLANKGVDDIQGFLDEVERQDAWIYTTRPQDLEELIESWKEKGQIGTRWEWINYSIERRLLERDQNRAEQRPFTLSRAREGAKFLAVATTLLRESSISVPEGSYQGRGLSAKRILGQLKWDDIEISTLLSRPIFDESVYGTVRFHHRTAKEFLTAEYLSELLSFNTSRKSIEELFFRKIYDIEVIDENMRSVLCWMVHMDQKIREKAVAIEPEIILEGGDPSRLPREEREALLESVCLRLHHRDSRRLSTGSGIVQRFASPDLSEITLRLADTYSDDSEVMWFLCKMVWRGKMSPLRDKALDLAKDIALDESARVSAIRALAEIGDDSDLADILDFYGKFEGGVERRVLATVIEYIEAKQNNLELIFEGIKNAHAFNRYRGEGLGEAICHYVQRLDTDFLYEFLKKIFALLNQEPHYERREIRISTEYGWLVSPVCKILEELLKARHKSIFEHECLDCLLLLPEAYHCHDFILTSQKVDLSSLVQEWPELNRTLFWRHVENRREFVEAKEKPLNDYWHVSIYDSFWALGTDDFDWALGQITERSFTDDRLIALTLANNLYVSAGRPRKWRERLKRKTANNEVLKDRLNLFLHPPKMTDEDKRTRRRHARWEEQHKKRKLKDELAEKKWKDWLLEHVETVRKPEFLNPHLFLHRRISELDSEGGHESNNYKVLIPVYGLDVAEAYKQGAIGFWRTYKPDIYSEVGDTKSTPYQVIYGLSGLSLEASENASWYKSLSKDEVAVATRYAIRELNSFPDWFDNFYKYHSAQVAEILIKEILWEVNEADDETVDTHYMLSRISWAYRWMSNDVSPALIGSLKSKSIANVRNLEHALTILNSSTVISDADIDELAVERIKGCEDENILALWIAVWIGVNPQDAFVFLENYLETLAAETAVQFSMKFIVNLLGDRRHSSSTRKNFETIGFLKPLYILMRNNIRPSDDFERVGTGCYSPELRDNAQDARNALFKTITEISGKETYIALLDFLDEFPEPSSQEVMRHNAFNRAVKDASMPPWSEVQLLEFIDNTEITPKNHEELYTLACRKLLNLKYDLEDGDTSIASILKGVNKETEIRKYLAGVLRDNSRNKYSVVQEDELADAKRPDIRILGIGFDAPVPIELKLAEKWYGSVLVERLENQLCGDYLRDVRSSRGIYLLVYGGERTRWEVAPSHWITEFDELVEYLKGYWLSISRNFANVDQIEVIGIDLTKRQNG